VDVVQLLIAADGVHIGIEALAHAEIIAFEGIALPLGQGMHHLALLAHGGHIEGDGALKAVEVIVHAGGFLDKQRSGYAAQIQRVGKLLLEIVLDEFDGHLHFIDAEGTSVAFGDKYLVHFLPSFCTGI